MDAGMFSRIATYCRCKTVASEAFDILIGLEDCTADHLVEVATYGRHVPVVAKSFDALVSRHDCTVKMLEHVVCVALMEDNRKLAESALERRRQTQREADAQ